MKKALSLILALVLCLSLSACKSKENVPEAYTTPLSGCIFGNDGRTLTFTDENCVIYHFVNGMGDEYKYTYTITEYKVTSDTIEMKIKLKDANRTDEIIDDEIEEMSYSMEDDTIFYYMTYYKVYDSTYDSTYDTAPQKSDSQEGTEELTDAEIESIVVKALYNEIDRKYDTADADSCKYSINKTEEKSGKIYVYGKVYLYDKYGEATTGWRDGSGSYSRSFTVTINTKSGNNYSCDID